MFNTAFSSHTKHYLRWFYIALITSTISACQINKLSNNWPSDLPPLEIFVAAHAEQSKRGTNDSTLDQHLVWIKRFYKGSIIYPIGWNDMIETVTSSFSLEQQEDAALAKQKLEDLGLRICIEWAQANDKRRINSSNIAVWGNALRTSVERNEQISFISIVEIDVQDMINGELSMQEISIDRYYPPEDYDNF